MRRVIFVICITLLSTEAFSYGNVHCVKAPTGEITCFTKVNLPQFTDAESATTDDCRARYPNGEFTTCNHPIVDHDFRNLCVAVHVDPQQQTYFAIEQKASDAVVRSLANCINEQHQGFSCTRLAVACDGEGVPLTANSSDPLAAPAPQEE